MKRKNHEIIGLTRSLFMLLIAFFIQFVVEITAMVICTMAVTLHENRQLSYNEIYSLFTKLLEENTLIMLMSVIAASAGIIVFGCWYYFGFVKSETEEETGRISFGSLPFLVLLGISMQVFWSMLLTAVEAWQPGWFEAYNELMENLDILGSLPALVYVVTAGPVAEELIFRGAILGNAKKYMPFLAANILQAALFGIYHMNMVQAVYAFCIGIVFGYIRTACKSIFASMALHISFNLTSVIIAWQVGEDIELSTGMEMGIIAASALFSILMLLPFAVKRKKESN